MTRLLCAAAACSLLIACSGGGGKSDPDANAGGDIDAATANPDAMPMADAAPPLTGLDALCQPGGAYEQLFDKVRECVTFLTIQVSPILGDELLDGNIAATLCDSEFRDFVDDGTLTVDDTKLQACIDYIAATDCENLALAQMDTTPCGDIFVGAVAIDGACDASQQCAGDAYCAPVPADCGTCTARLVNGEVCSNDEQCQSLNCNGAGLCANAANLGEACNSAADCNGNLTCGPDMTCRPFVLGAGETCSDHDECGFPYVPAYCDFPAAPFFGVTGTCAPLPSAGEACITEPGFPIEDACNFFEYAWCDTFTGTCQPPTSSAEGEPCHSFAIVGAGARKCDPGLMCTRPIPEGSTLGTCVKPGLPGDSCELATSGGFMVPPSTCHTLLECNDTTLLCESNSKYTGLCPAP
jgi:hypothetical protein